MQPFEVIGEIEPEKDEAGCDEGIVKRTVQTISSDNSELL
jgi:hypothetical protein